MMISVDKETATIRGTKLDIQTELTCLINHLLKHKILTKKDIQESINVASMTDEELINDMLSKLLKLM